MSRERIVGLGVVVLTINTDQIQSVTFKVRQGYSSSCPGYVVLVRTQDLYPVFSFMNGRYPTL